MTGARQILRTRFRIHCDTDRMGAVIRRDPGSNTFSRINGFAESSAETCRVDGRHRLQIQSAANLRVERQTNEPAPMRGHEIDGFRSDSLRSNRKVALVLAILVIYDHENFPLAKIFDCLGDG